MPGRQGIGQLLRKGRLDRELRRAGRQFGQSRVDIGERSWMVVIRAEALLWVEIEAVELQGHDGTDKLIF